MVFLDSNVLIYAFSVDPRRERAISLLEDSFVISVQSLNEFVHVMRRKGGEDWSSIDDYLASLVAAASSVRGILPETQRDAMRLAKRYRFSTYDAQIVASALDAGCDTVLSEDMQDGLRVDGRLTIRNPFD